MTLGAEIVYGGSVAGEFVAGEKRDAVALVESRFMVAS